MLNNEGGVFRIGLEMGTPLEDGDVLWVRVYNGDFDMGIVYWFNQAVQRQG